MDEAQLDSDSRDGTSIDDLATFLTAHNVPLDVSQPLPRLLTAAASVKSGKALWVLSRALRWSATLPYETSHSPPFRALVAKSCRFQVLLDSMCQRESLK